MTRTTPHAPTRSQSKRRCLWATLALLALGQALAASANAQGVRPATYFQDGAPRQPVGGASPEVVIQPVQATSELAAPASEPPAFAPPAATLPSAALPSAALPSAPAPGPATATPTPLLTLPTAPASPSSPPEPRAHGLFTLPAATPPDAPPAAGPTGQFAQAPPQPSPAPQAPPVPLASQPAPAGDIAQNPPAASTGNLLPPTVMHEIGVVWGHVSAVWNFVIVCGADGKPLVTVGTLIGGIVLLGVGYVVAGMISRWIGSRLLGRLGLHPSARAPLQSISYYVLLITFGMLTLNILNVPITVFSFLGGALAIGAGFGSQNIVNNFISGLILLAERPIRVGDVVEIDGRSGRVTDIGARSTRLVTQQNVEVVVPNSKILENQFTNWTLGDDRVYTGIKIGVAYGSPTRKVAELLKQAAGEHPAVLQEPEIEVLFDDFGADALIFELRFSLHLLQCFRREVESDIRYRIDELFSQAGIVIAYPQRDVHLNVLRPLEVRLAGDPPRELRSRNAA